MAKTSTVQLKVGVIGDGMTSTNIQTQTNASAPASGAVEVTLTAAINAVPVPAGATGLLITPGTAPDFAFGYGAGYGGYGLDLDPTKAHFVSLVGSPATINISSQAGGTIFIQWV